LINEAMIDALQPESTRH